MSDLDSVYIATSVYRLTTGWMAGVGFLLEERDFLYSTVSGLALGPPKPPVQQVSGAMALELRPGRESDTRPSVTRLSRQCESLYVSQGFRPPQPAFYFTVQ
jgi:hypothetical protein